MGTAEPPLAQMQRSCRLRSRQAELEWEAATGLVLELSAGEEREEPGPGREEVGELRQGARVRLLESTRCLQQLLPPLPAGLLQSSERQDRECGIYALARQSLSEACAAAAQVVACPCSGNGSSSSSGAMAACAPLWQKGGGEGESTMERFNRQLEEKRKRVEDGLESLLGGRT